MVSRSWIGSYNHSYVVDGVRKCKIVRLLCFYEKLEEKKQRIVVKK